MDWRATLRKTRLEHVVLVMSILALIGWGFSVWQWRGYVECQAEVSDRVIQVLTLRSAAQDNEREAEVQADRAFKNAMNALLAQPPRTQPERLAALTTLQRALDEQDRQRAMADEVRAEHPIPDLPSRSCR